MSLIEKKTIENKPAFRMQGDPEGAWRVSNSPFDAMIDLTTATLKIDRTEAYHAIGIDGSQVSRCRNNLMKGIPESWILRLFDYSGIPVEELRLVAGIEATVCRHPKARKA